MRRSLYSVRKSAKFMMNRPPVAGEHPRQAGRCVCVVGAVLLREREQQRADDDREDADREHARAAG